MPTSPARTSTSRIAVLFMVIMFLVAAAWVGGQIMLWTAKDIAAGTLTIGSVISFTLVLSIVLLAGFVGQIFEHAEISSSSVLVSWVVVATAFGSLVSLTREETATNSSFLAPMIAAYMKPTDDSASVSPPTVRISPSGTLEVGPTLSVGSDDNPRIIWYLANFNEVRVSEHLAEGCRLFRDPAFYSCPADQGFTVPGYLTPEESGLTTRRLSVEVDRTHPILEEVPLTISFPTYEMNPLWDDRLSFDRIVAGNGAVTPDAIEFRSNEQGEASEWTAAVELRVNGAATIFAIYRDLLLVVLGGAVTLTLVPRRTSSSVRVPTGKTNRQRKRLSSRPESRRRVRRLRRSI